MAKKIKRRIVVKPTPQGVEDLLDADQLQAATRDAFDWINEHRKPVLTGLGLVLVAIIVVSFGIERYRQRNVPASEGVYAIMLASTSADSSPQDNAQQMRAAYMAASADHSGSRALEFGAWLDSSAALLDDDAASAAAGYNAMSESSFGEARAIGELGRAVTAAANGDLSEASSILRSLGEREPSAAIMAAITEARLIDTYGEPRAALDAMRGIEDRYPEADGMDAIRSRIQQLEVVLDAADSESDAG